MIKINKRIEIVSSSKSSLSSMSQESRDAVFTVLTKHYARVDVTIVNNLSDLEALVARKPDLVFLGMKFVLADYALNSTNPAKIWVAKYLDRHNIAYTGSGQMAHKLERDKPLAKQRVLNAGLNTSPFYIAQQDQPQNEADMSLPYPVFIKPTNRGSGLGIDSDSVVHNFAQLRSKVCSIATDLQSDSLVEEYLPGREFSVAILKDEHSAQFSVMPIELIAPPDENGARILSGKVKSADTERFIEVADQIVKAKVMELAIDIFHALGGRDYGRVDIRLDKAGTPQFLEANLLPSLISGYGSFPKACVLNIGLDYESMILSIVRLGLARSVDVTDEELEQNRLIVSALEPALETAGLSLS